MNVFQLNNVRKLRILELLYDAADEYAKCMNKEYLFVTEFNNCYSGFFFDEDFLHLSGITLSQPVLIPRFFSMCRNRTFRIENIAGVQTHTYKTLIKKLTNLLSLKNFVENRIDGQNLVIDKPSTSTRSFKYALRNNQSRFTLEFDKRNNARSNRNELVAQGSSYERVIFIFSSTGKDVFSELIYMKEDCSIVKFLENNRKRFSLTLDGGLKRITS
ncbi:MAG: hypothetical protein ACI32B_08580 [Erysipelotrichaceae bacterium]